MKPVKQNETQVIIVVPVVDRTPTTAKSKINPAILKAIRLIVIATIHLLYPEATIAIVPIKLPFMLLEWLNQNQTKKNTDEC